MLMKTSATYKVRECMAFILKESQARRVSISRVEQQGRCHHADAVRGAVRGPLARAARRKPTYFTAPSVLADVLNTATIWSRSACTAPIVATAIKASSIAYSAIEAPV